MLRPHKQAPALLADYQAMVLQERTEAMEMTTYLFIYAILAGAGAGRPYSANEFQWRAQWVNSGKFDRPDYCHKAAANLGLKKEEYRCIDISGSVQ